MRIEDVDETRSRAGAAEAILATLEAYGFEWDGPVVRAKRARRALRAGARPLDSTAAWCLPARARGESWKRRHPGQSGERVYPGTCRHGLRRRARRTRLARRGRRRIVRFRRPPAGQQQQQLLDRDVGDFVLKRADGLFAYQLAVVVDDACKASPTSCAAPIFSPRRHGRSGCSGNWDSRRRRIFIIRSRSTRAGRKLSKQTGANAAARRSASGICARHGVFSIRRPPTARRHRWRRSGAGRIARGMRALCLRSRCCPPCHAAASRSLDSGRTV